ncbi:hypothetical protein DFR59_11012 [Falsibacillus pallidus]|uniref:Uncharacterized protein n=1 Tax=Falsibacillus pallidus TaxID=493781 RepID=A0A370GBB0_9BACI|nr:hypothetical protein DFR59_11012 [Falsibacillus pallidus]
MFDNQKAEAKMKVDFKDVVWMSTGVTIILGLMGIFVGM